MENTQGFTWNKDLLGSNTLENKRKKNKLAHLPIGILLNKYEKQNLKQIIIIK